MPVDVGSLLACPECRSRIEQDGGEALCTGCGVRYPLAAGVPVLLPPGSEPPRLEERWYGGARGVLPPRLVGALEPYRARLRPPLTYKTRRSRRVVDRFVASLGPDASVLNVGAGRTEYGPNVVNLDIEPGGGVHVVGVAEQLPIADGSCAGVVLMAVLEHVQDADRALAEAHRVLAPGGALLVDVPFVQGYHPSPADYRRFTEQGLRAEAERRGFEVEESGIAVGPGSAMAWVAAEFLALLLSGRSAKGYRLAKLATTWLALPLKYTDAWLERHPMAYSIPSAVWVRARRVG